MAYKIRGEVGVESGLGLPRLTQLQRLAYTPPKDGYVVFDTELKSVCIWDANAVEWIIQGKQPQVDGKIDALNGVGIDSLTLQTASDVDAVKMSGDGVSTKQEFFESGILTSTITSTTTDLAFVADGGAAITLNATHTLTNQPIRGVDEADPTSLVTKSYVDGFVVDGEFTSTFNSVEWATGSSPNTYTVLQATHGIPHSSGTSYDVVVQELVSGAYCTISIETEVDSTTGDVIIKSLGAPFTGRIFIS